MATQVQLRRGTSTQNDAFTGAQGELTYDTTNKRVRIHDGGTAGGFEIKTEDGSGNTIFADNEKAIFGAGSDLQIYHDAVNGNSVIHDAGSGNLRIRANDFQVTNAGNTANLIFANDTTGEVKLYHNGSEKLATTSTGIDVTGGFTATDGCTITTADNTAQLTLTSTDADADTGPQLVLDRNSSSPADNDRVGEITFQGRNDANQTTEYAVIQSRIIDASDGTEDGRIIIQNMMAGDVAGVMENNGTETVFNNNSKDLDFRVESDSNANAFFLEGSTGNVGIGTSSPNTTTQISKSTTSTDGSVYPTLKIENTSAGTGNSYARFQVNGGNGTTTFTLLADGRSSNSDVSLRTNTSTPMSFYTNGTERMRIDSSGNVGIGETAPLGTLHVRTSDAGITSVNINSDDLIIENNGNCGITIASSTTGEGMVSFVDSGDTNIGRIQYQHDTNEMNFRVNDAERMRITSAGNVGIGTSTPDTNLDVEGAGDCTITITANSTSHDSKIDFAHGSTVDGGITYDHNGSYASEKLIFRAGNNGSHISLDGNGTTLINTTFTNVVSVDARHGIVLSHNTTNAATGVCQFSANGHSTIIQNRDSDDGNLTVFRQNANQEGTISVSGSTVSYNSFSGSHWSRLTDNSKPTILKGTVIETIDEMCDWYQAQFDIQEEGETRRVKQSIALPSDASVGDTLTVSFEGNDYTATIVREADNKHTKCKISDTADSTRVYGVYSAWDNEDDTVNDMYVTAVGTHVVRVNSSVTVSAGDLLTSNGDGTAKVQDDDIIRSKTIGKVLTNIVQETYDDGSYTVPCALYCG